MANTEEQGLLAAIKEKPDDFAARMIYADWLDEHDRLFEALQQRVKAGVSEVRYKIRRKSDGLYSEGVGDDVSWSAKGKDWRGLAPLKAHLAHYGHSKVYHGDTPMSDVEVVVFEVRVTRVGALPIVFEEQPGRGRKVVIEPPGGGA